MNFQLIPEWIVSYEKNYLRRDIFAGLTVGVMLIPQGMAYAIIAGLPPVYGLYAALVPIVVYALFGTSRQLAVGPVAMDSLLVAQFIGTMAKVGTEHYITLALLLAFLMGTIQFLLGTFRMGFLVNFLSKPVISGFTSAAAIIIGLSQLKYLTGIKMDRNNQLQKLAVNFFQNMDQVHWITLGIGVGAIILIKVIKKWNSKLPAALIVVVLGTLLVWGLKLEGNGVNVVGVVPEGLPSFRAPLLDWELIQELLPMAATIGLVAFMEAISISKAVQAKHKDYQINPNRELVALGAANLVGSLFQSYPVTGGFSRTAVNDQAGAKTPLSSLISAALIGLTLLFLTPLFYYLPKAVLASIIMVAVFGLVDFSYPAQLWKSRKIEFVMLLVTFVVTLTVGITIGIGTGVVLSIVVMVYLSTKPHVAELGRIIKSNQYRNTNRFEGLEVKENTLIVRFDAPMYFANVQYLKDKVLKLAAMKGEKLELIVLNMESVGLVDSSALQGLEELYADFKTQNIEFYFCGTIGPVRDVMFNYGFVDRIGAERFFLDIHYAVDKFEQTLSKNREEKNKMALQTNLNRKSDKNH